MSVIKLTINYSATFFLAATTATPRAATRTMPRTTNGVESPVVVVPLLVVDVVDVFERVLLVELVLDVEPPVLLLSLEPLLSP